MEKKMIAHKDSFDKKTALSLCYIEDSLVQVLLRTFQELQNEILTIKFICLYSLHERKFQ